MKTTISIPDRVFHAAEETAARLSMSRSELYTRAIEAFLEACPAVDVTEKLNEVYADNPSGLEPGMLQMQRLSLRDESW